jgi:hypothetical protein
MPFLAKIGKNKIKEFMTREQEDQKKGANK